VICERRKALRAADFRNHICQLIDSDLSLRLMLRSAVCFFPQELSVRTHTAATETTRNVTTRRELSRRATQSHFDDR
jgi:hypothetical protein